MKKVTNASGFTLIEALIVVAIVAVVGGVGLFAYHRYNQAHASGWTAIGVQYTPPKDAKVKIPTLIGCKVLLSATKTKPAQTQLYLQMTRSTSLVKDFYVSTSSTSLLSYGSSWVNNISKRTVTFDSSSTKVEVSYHYGQGAYLYLYPTSQPPVGNCNVN